MGIVLEQYPFLWDEEYVDLETLWIITLKQRVDGANSWMVSEVMSSPDNLPSKYYKS